MAGQPVQIQFLLQLLSCFLLNQIEKEVISLVTFCAVFEIERFYILVSVVGKVIHPKYFNT